MSRFNTTIQPNKTVNFAGGESYVQNPKLEFVSILLTNFVKDQFYRGADDTISRVAELIHQIPDKSFAAKAAIYARTKYGMRSISHVVAGEIARTVKGESWTKSFFNKIVYRPDDMSEILSYYYSANGEGKEPNSLKKGFAQAISRFDEYQLAKYKGEGKLVSLIDIANLVHPAHTDAIEKLIKGTLPTPKTWETQLSKAGQAEDEETKEAQKKEVWVELIKTRKIGYFALLRNLRNILEQAPEVVNEACSLLVDENLIRKSLVLPFRFPKALEEIVNLSGCDTALVRQVIVAIHQAIDISLSNVPKFDGNTLVVLDESGSMGQGVGTPHGIGTLFAAVLVKSNNADFMAFSDDARYMNLNPMDSTATLASMIERHRTPSGTNFHAIFEEANKPYNRIIILSDMQGWIGYNAPTATFAQYKSRVGANPFIYSFDLQGYGSLQFPENNVFCLAGFSEKVFDIMKLLESDKNALINEIEKIEL